MKTIRRMGCVFAAWSLAACGDPSDSLSLMFAAEPRQQAPQATLGTKSPTMTVYKNATCGCCGKWVEHMQQHGFKMTVHDVDNMSPVKERVGLPYGMGSCHTAEVDGYFIEGHVPAKAVARLLREKPAAKGLAVPGMPVGSPGMEQGDVRQPYDVMLVKADGTSEVFEHYPEKP